MTERPINNRQTEKSNKELIAHSDRQPIPLRPISMDIFLGYPKKDNSSASAKNDTM